MQISLYNKGTKGFVIHSITGNFKGKASGYFNAAGELEDAEQILPSARHGLIAPTVRPIKKDGPIWKYIESKKRTVEGYIKQKIEEAAQ